ncbi:hypothetical protein ACPPVT_00650 [Angustibacter sp. McL0619]|uniref:hypothetical protein n=1 Tax=Angustibacter sp. McL0619 TaxID=3415676 RepID=UPI003CF60BD4
MTLGFWTGQPTSPSRVLRDRVWTVTCQSTADGVVQVDRTRDGMRIAVGDRRSEPEQSTVLRLARDGSLTVSAAATPPALLVSPDGARTVPAVPGLTEQTRLDVGERLLVLSADALDAMPASLAAVFQALSAQVTGRDPVELLDELFAALPRGSAVIVTRRPASAPPEGIKDPATGLAVISQGRHQEEATWGSAQHS